MKPSGAGPQSPMNSSVYKISSGWRFWHKTCDRRKCSDRVARPSNGRVRSSRSVPGPTGIWEDEALSPRTALRRIRSSPGTGRGCQRRRNFLTFSHQVRNRPDGRGITRKKPYDGPVTDKARSLLLRSSCCTRPSLRFPGERVSVFGSMDFRSVSHRGSESRGGKSPDGFVEFGRLAEASKVCSQRRVFDRPRLAGFDATGASPRSPPGPASLPFAKVSKISLPKLSTSQAFSPANSLS